MKPLSPITFVVRSPGKSLPFVGVILLSVVLIMGIVTMMNSIPLSIMTTYSYIGTFAAITPRGDPERTPAILEKLTKSPVKLERVVICRASGGQVNSIVGKLDFPIFGLAPEDVKYFLKKQGIETVAGRLPVSGAPEAVISRPVATNLHLKLGDALLKPTDQDMYSPQTVKVVGIAESSAWFAIDDIQYQRENHFPPLDNVLCFAPTDGEQITFGRWAKKAFKGERSYVFTREIMAEDTAKTFHILYQILDIVIATLVAVVTLMMGMLMNIQTSQRMVEFGLLQALGFTKRSLATRVLIETVIVLLVGWVLGVSAAVGLLTVAKVKIFDPNAFLLSAFDQTAVRYTMPIPLAILAAGVISVWLRFRRFDPVGVVERRLV